MIYSHFFNPEAICYEQLILLRDQFEEAGRVHGLWNRELKDKSFMSPVPHVHEYCLDSFYKQWEAEKRTFDKMCEMLDLDPEEARLFCRIWIDLWKQEYWSRFDIMRDLFYKMFSD